MIIKESKHSHATILGLQEKMFSKFRIANNGGQCITCGNCSTYCEMGNNVRNYAEKNKNIKRSCCADYVICAAVCPIGVLKLENGKFERRINSDEIVLRNDVNLPDSKNELIIITFDMKKIILTICFLAFSILTQAQTTQQFFDQTSEFLKKNVTEEGKVDYSTIKKSPGELIYILSNIEKLDTKFTDKKLAKAFWINVYNLQVIRSIVNVFPVASIEKVAGFFDAVPFTVGNQQLTLDDIENVILRDLFFDPAVHFTLSSGANGGAPLLNTAYLPNKVDEQIKRQATLVINAKNYYFINKELKVIELPKIFEWYKKDFAVNYFNEIDFINLFLEKKIDNKLTVKTYDFDWSINKI